MTLRIVSAAEPIARHLPIPIVSNELTTHTADPLEENAIPIIAIWEDSPGYATDTNYPYLRVAVWQDGRVVFARDPNAWDHDLLIGQLSAKALTTLEQSIRQTGVFELKGYCYLVPDAPVDCVMLSFGGSQQILYWDEVENTSYGININPKRHHIAFKKAWWEVNRLVLSALPHQADKLESRFRRPPKNWYPKRTIQSE